MTDQNALQQQAINSILLENIENVAMGEENETNLNNHNTNSRNYAPKRKQTEGDDVSSREQSPERKKLMANKPRYEIHHKGPYEVVVQHKEKKRLSPFQIGKIFKQNEGIDNIKRTGSNITITSKTYSSANDLLLSEELKHYNVFIPTRRIYSTGVVYVDPEITENEVKSEAYSEHSIVTAQRIKKRVNGELKDTYFVKILFNSNTLPKEIKLNHVLMRVDPYMIPVKQCFKCFAYSHVANSQSAPCEKTRVCRDCGDKFHSGDCTKPLKCVNCDGDHSSNSRTCPEYLRQVDIKARMSLYNEDYFTASKWFPNSFKKPYQNNRLRPTPVKTYAETTQIICDPNNFDEYPNLDQNSQNKTYCNNSNRYHYLNQTNTDHSAQTEQEINPSLMRNPNRPNQGKKTKLNLEHTYAKTQRPIQEQKTRKSFKYAPVQLPISDRKWLVRKLRAKIDEMRCNISENCTKKDFETLIDTYLNEEIFTENRDRDNDKQLENIHNTGENPQSIC